MMPPLPVSWGASLASMSGSPATTELLTTRPSASVVVRRAPGGTDALGQLTSLMCWLVTVSARPRLVAATACHLADHSVHEQARQEADNGGAEENQQESPTHVCPYLPIRAA